MICSFSTANPADRHPSPDGENTLRHLELMIDPTTEDNWLRDHFQSRPYVQKGETFDTYHPAYRYGGEAEFKYPNDEFDAVEDRLASEWNAADKRPMPWTKARGAVKDAYDRTVQLRRARECPEACDEVEEED